jgi:hypothetical protein
MNIWKGTLTLKGERGREGPSVEARVLSSTSAILEIREPAAADWRSASAEEIHPQSLLPALAATGPEVG